MINNHSNNRIYSQGELKFKFDIHMETNIFDRNHPLLLEIINNKKCLIVISETINTLYKNKIENYLIDNRIQYKLICIKTSEINKEMSTVLSICNAGKEYGLDRRSIIVGIGGGILLDMVGFAASIYKRKINYLRIPTTLLGQIDAGIGIKTGINFLGSKNFLGSYHPPMATINDLSFLHTLNTENILSGFAEIIKMALILDSDLFHRIDSDYAPIIESNFSKNKDKAMTINEKAINLMLEELEKNYYEDNLKRLVDFGHTFSPYIEEASSYSISHGLAVAIDIALSIEISYLKGIISEEEQNKVIGLLIRMGYDIYHPSLNSLDLLYESLEKIKLHRGGSLNLVIPDSIGSAIFLTSNEDLPYELLKTALINLANYSKKYSKEPALNSL